ncbi:MAG: hypothetical protein LW750_04195 [Bacteroidetes bacterium]|jgi:hypothetical protein|nr:hypothetical protein [Bacteroidota bacterium]
MKKVFSIVAVAGIVAFASCGDAAEAAKKLADSLRADSIRLANIADSTAKAFSADSAKQANAADSAAKAVAADSVAKAAEVKKK